jgi:cation transport ATPase
MKPHPLDTLDLYEILQVAPDASADEIKRAYRTLARRYHPDLHASNPDVAEESAAMMRKLNEAYTVLSNSARRRDYDEQRQKHTAYDSARPRARGAAGARKHRIRWWNTFFAAVFGYRWLRKLRQRLLAQPATSERTQLMGTLSKMLLLPIPFCLPVMVFAFFWHLGNGTGFWLLVKLTAVLAYPLILFPLLVRLWFPIHYRPVLSDREKLISIPITVIVTMLLGWLWYVVADHSGTIINSLDIYWWCSLIVISCASLAYL